jgi:hypothetical protein
MEKPIKELKRWTTSAKGNLSSLGIEIGPNTARKAKCCYSCGALSESNPKLPFFKAKPECDYDEYYCGCYGWD